MKSSFILFVMLLSATSFIFNDPEKTLLSNTWCSDKDQTSCLKFIKGELIFIRENQVSDQVRLTKHSDGDNWIIYSINNQNHVQNKYTLLSKDSLLVRQIDYGIESKRTSLYIKK